MIAASQALATLERMLADAGFDKSRPDTPLAWRVFKQFASIPVAAATDGLLFQCGTYGFSGEPAFEFDFTRQFTQEEKGDEPSMEQLSCTLYYPPSNELGALNTNLWSFSYDSAAAFFAAVEALPEFRSVVERHQPSYAALRQEEV
jgi:hypothetical protein